MLAILAVFRGNPTMLFYKRLMTMPYAAPGPCQEAARTKQNDMGVSFKWQTLWWTSFRVDKTKTLPTNHVGHGSLSTLIQQPFTNSCLDPNPTLKTL